MIGLTLRMTLSYRLRLLVREEALAQQTKQAVVSFCRNINTKEHSGQKKNETQMKGSTRNNNNNTNNNDHTDKNVAIIQRVNPRHT